MIDGWLPCNLCEMLNERRTQHTDSSSKNGKPKKCYWESSTDTEDLKPPIPEVSMLHSIDARLCILELLSVELKEMLASLELNHKEIRSYKELKRDECLKITVETLTKEMDKIVKEVKTMKETTLDTASLGLTTKRESWLIIARPEHYQKKEQLKSSRVRYGLDAQFPHETNATRGSIPFLSSIEWKGKKLELD